MKRIVAVLSLILVLVMAFAPMAFASGLEIEGINPADGKKGLQVSNMCIKVKFSEDVSDPENDEINKTKIAIYKGDEKQELTYQVAHSDKKTNELWYVVDGTLESNTEYTVVIDKGVVANSKNTLGEKYTSTFNTRNTKNDSTLSLLLMVAMMVIMVFATSKAAKKSAAANDPRLIERQREEALNPYKIAKEKNISIDEAKAYVAKEKEKYRKEQEKIAAEKARKEAERAAEIEAMERKIEAELAAQRDESVFRVKAPASITKSGREVPKAISKAKKKRQEAKLAKERAAQAAREANSKGKKSKK